MPFKTLILPNSLYMAAGSGYGQELELIFRSSWVGNVYNMTFPFL